VKDSSKKKKKKAINKNKGTPQLIYLTARPVTLYWFDIIDRLRKASVLANEVDASGPGERGKNLTGQVSTEEHCYY
jgi:hypothetical protein